MAFQTFLYLLTLAFIILKLTGYIGWSWFWVLLPIIWPLLALGIILCILAICVVLEALGIY